LLQQKTPLAAAVQSHFAHKLLVSGLASGRAGNSRQQFSISHTLRVGYLALRGCLLPLFAARMSFRRTTVFMAARQGMDYDFVFQALPDCASNVLAGYLPG
jgi:hypothetical protein